MLIYNTPIDLETLPNHGLLPSKDNNNTHESWSVYTTERCFVCCIPQVRYRWWLLAVSKPGELALRRQEKRSPISSGTVRNCLRVPEISDGSELILVIKPEEVNGLGGLCVRLLFCNLNLISLFCEHLVLWLRQNVLSAYDVVLAKAMYLCLVTWKYERQKTRKNEKRSPPTVFRVTFLIFIQMKHFPKHAPLYYAEY